MLVARRLSAVFGLALCTLAGTAAAMPAVLDRVPTDAAIVVAVPSVDQLEKDIKAVAELVGQPLPVGVEAILSQMGITTGFNKAGAMVIVMNELPVDGGEKSTLVLVPTSDYAGLLKGFETKPSGGIDEVKMPTGESAFVRSLDGGYAIVGADKALVEKFGPGGHAAAHEKAIGPAGKSLADNSDMFIVVNVEKIRPLLKQGFDSAMETMAAQMAMMAGGDEAQMNPEAAKFLGEMFIADTQALVASVNIDTMGISMDLGFNFKADSKLAKAAGSGGNSSALIAKLPAMPYLFAAAADFSSPDFKELLRSIPKPKNAADMGIDLNAGIEHANGTSIIAGIPSGGLMGGVLTRTVSFQATTDYAGSMTALRKGLDAMKIAKAGEGKFTEAGAEVDGQKVDVWEMKLNADPDNPQMMQGMMAMFGPAGGPSGYIAKVDGGYIQTYSKSSELASAAMKSAKGEGSLAQDKVISQVADKLPKGRRAEFYIGVKGILDSTLPMVAMFTGQQLKFDMPPTVPPVAGAITPMGGGVVATIYLPNQTIKTVAQVVKAFEDSRNQAENGDEDMGNRGGQKKGDKPGF